MVYVLINESSSDKILGGFYGPAIHIKLEEFKREINKKPKRIHQRSQPFATSSASQLHGLNGSGGDGLSGGDTQESIDAIYHRKVIRKVTLLKDFTEYNNNIYEWKNKYNNKYSNNNIIFLSEYECSFQYTIHSVINYNKFSGYYDLLPGMFFYINNKIFNIKKTLK